MIAIQNSMSPDTAALTTAAPEMLAVLKVILDEVRDYGPNPFSSDSYLPTHMKDRIAAAIAKAEGTA